MPSEQPDKAFKAAVDRLAALEPSVAAQERLEDVAQAIVDLRLAVARAYGGRRLRSPSGQGARQAILRYLRDRCGEWVYGEEIAAISGIGEWARRIRELRVEHGYDIEEESGMYCLTSPNPDVRRAERWRLVGEIQMQSDETALDRVSQLLRTCVGEIVTRDELDRVARGKVGARLARELRNDSLWPVESWGDAADLKPGDFRLVSGSELDHTDRHQHLFPEDLRHEVFRRDRHSCWTCGRDRPSAARQGTGPFYLQLRHLDASGDALERLAVEQLLDKSRLATTCNHCLSHS